jgi:hypothetical protein
LERLAPGGEGIHSTQGLIRPAELVALQRVKKRDKVADALARLPRTGMIWVDGPVLQKDEIERCGVADLKTDKEGIYCTFSFRKP